MSKINNVRLPNAISTQYSPEQFNQMVRSIEQIVLQLNTTYSSNLDADTAAAQLWFKGGGGGGFAGGIPGPQYSNGILLPYAMLMSDEDQPSAGTTSENLLTYNLPIFTSGVTVTNGSEMRFSRPGQYLITVSVQFANRGNAAAEFEMWAKNTGNNYPLSNTRFDIPARKSGSVWAHVVANIAGIFTVNDPANEFLEIAWWASGADVFAEHFPAGTSPTRPEIPSVILTASFASAPGGPLG